MTALPDLGAFGRDLNKRLTDQESQKAPKHSPAFTGAPTSTTPSKGDKSTRIATTAFVLDAIDGSDTVAHGVYAAFSEFAKAHGI